MTAPHGCIARGIGVPAPAHRCEYCGLPDTVSSASFEIDHIIARKHGGKTSPENLALSCFYRNSQKGSNIAGIDPDTGALSRLFHPRDDRWNDHFRWNGAILCGTFKRWSHNDRSARHQCMGFHIASSRVDWQRAFSWCRLKLWPTKSVEGRAAADRASGHGARKPFNSAPECGQRSVEDFGLRQADLQVGLAGGFIAGGLEEAGGFLGAGAIGSDAGCRRGCGGDGQLLEQS